MLPSIAEIGGEFDIDTATLDQATIDANVTDPNEEDEIDPVEDGDVDMETQEHDTEEASTNSDDCNISVITSTTTTAQQIQSTPLPTASPLPETLPSTTTNLLPTPSWEGYMMSALGETFSPSVAPLPTNGSRPVTFFGVPRPLGAPIFGFSHLYHATDNYYLILDDKGTLHHISVYQLKEVLCFATLLGKSRDQSKIKEGKFINEPVGYRETVTLLNADPAQQKKLPVIHANGSITYGHKDYPLQVHCPSFADIKDAKRLEGVMGDMDLGRLNRIALRSAKAALDLASSSGGQKRGNNFSRGAGKAKRARY